MKKGRNTPSRILLCDGDSDMLLIEVYLQQLTDRKFVIVKAHNTSEIESAFREGNIGLVLMELDVEDKSSLYRVRQIVEKHIAPVVLLAEHGSEKTAVQSLQEGVLGYLPKSNLSKEQLIQTMDCAVTKWEAMTRSMVHQDKLERLANIDSLTGLLNRRAILQKLKESITRASRYGEKFCVIILDVDNFKQINDAYGHKAGDNTLRKVAALLQRRLRDADTVGRYGGDEFLIILPHTDQACVIHPAERIRKAIEGLRMKGNSYSVTASLGVVEYKASDEYTTIIDRADNRLYNAKQNGRNCMCV